MISFIIPAYNTEKNIEKCVESITKQKTSIDYEVLIVNDGSKDGTGCRAEMLERTFSQVRVINKNNGGVSSARNCGINNAKGDYVTFCDSDDIIADDFFEKIQGYEDYDLTVYGYKYIVQEKTNIISSSNCCLVNDEQAFLHLYKNRLFNPVWNKIYKKELIQNLFDEEYLIGEDLLFNIQYLPVASDIRVLKDPLYEYIITPGSITQTYKKTYIDNFTKCLQCLKLYKKKLGNLQFFLIEKDYIDNVVGTIGLLVNHSQYDFNSKMQEIKRIYHIFEEQEIDCVSDIKFHNFIISLLSSHMYWGVICCITLKDIIKKILKYIEE